MTCLSRRTFTKALAAASWVLRAQTAPTAPASKIDTERVIGDIDPKIYGNFIEHLGRCIEGGVFDEKSPLSDSNGFRKDVLAAVKDLNVSILRWPGGNFSSNYHWMDGIGPRDNRPPRLEMAWGTVESNRFGTHEFMKYVEMVGAEPYFCANLGTGTWTEAQQWVEYCNSSQDTAMTRLRKQNGRGPVEGHVLGPRQRDGRPLANGPSHRGRLRQVRPRSRQADEAGPTPHQADRRRLLEFQQRHRLDRLEPHRARISQAAGRLPVAAYVRRQPGQRLRRFPGQLDDPRQRIKTTEGVINAALATRPPSAKSTSRGTSGTSGIAPAAKASSAAATSSKSATTWKTRWSWPRSSTPS
jgi:hypothetical protein